MNIFQLLDDSIPSRSFLYSMAPTSDIWEKDGMTFVELEVPGARPEDVEISAQDGVLKVTWKRRVRGSEEKSYKTYRLSKDADIDSAEARIENGLLTVSLKKLPAAAPKKIPILSAGMLTE